MTLPLLHATREQWLCAAAAALITRFRIPPRGPWRVTCGWPSQRALSAQGRILGQCWPVAASGDRTIELIISISLDDPIEVLAVLVHELVHAHLSEGVGHRTPFPTVVRAIGLEGPPSATRPGQGFREAAVEILASVGRYPHASLDLSLRKKQGTRMIKGACPLCGYTIRLSRLWLAVAVPLCPVHEVEMQIG